ncbi:serine protease [Bradyrhizobium cosmicum]|uniref:S1 family peptidase n=1 Tax=Bradyrhizobium cosmicum TaxID=1404864 RepID=UPI0028E3A886|nr:serine protease [Bradyrhizobium cosmicum]
MTETAEGAAIDVEAIAPAIVKVGGGRGFIVSSGTDHYVITAAHCLPRSRYPRPHLANSGNDLIFPEIIGQIGSKKRNIWGELCVLSLTDDIAVLAAPDNQSLPERADEYERFTGTALSVGISPVAVPPSEWHSLPGAPAWVLSVQRQWVPCAVFNNGRFLYVRGASIESGMSGSPILDTNGAAIGAISTSSNDDTVNMHPSLTDCLPTWLLRKLEHAQRLNHRSESKP